MLKIAVHVSIYPTYLCYKVVGCVQLWSESKFIWFVDQLTCVIFMTGGRKCIIKKPSNSICSILASQGFLLAQRKIVVINLWSSSLHIIDDIKNFLILGFMPIVDFIRQSSLKTYLIENFVCNRLHKKYQIYIIST